MEITDKYQKAKRTISISEKLAESKIPYRRWNGQEVNLGESPLYVSQKKLTNLKNIDCLSSSGFINIIRRRLGLGVPEYSYNGKNLSGTIVSYMKKYKGSMRKSPEKLCTGDLLIWKSRTSSQCHMAVYNKKEKTVFHSIPFVGVTETPLKNVVEDLGDQYYVVSREVWLYS